MIEYRKILPDELLDFRKLRLSAINENASFLDYSRTSEVSESLHFHLRMLYDHIVVGAYVDGTLSGMSCGSVVTQRRLSHKAISWGTYIKPSLRNSQVGRNMLLNVMQRLSKRGVTQCTGAIVTSNENAIKMCHGIGFCDMYVERNGIRTDDGFDDLLHIIKYLEI